MSQTPFSRFINWFKLSIEREFIYEFTNSTPAPDDYFLRMDGKYYSLTNQDHCKAVDFVGEIRKRSIAKAFQQALRPKGFAFKGKFNSIAYYVKSYLNRAYRDIFGMHTGFEYRIWENSDGYTENGYLVIDPHIVLTMNANLHRLTIEGMYGRKLEAKRLENFAIKIVGESVKRIDERSFGIDGILLSARVTSSTELICQVLLNRSGEVHEVPAQDVYLEPRPEVVRDVVLKGLNINNFDLIKELRRKSFLESNSAAKDRYLKTVEIVENYLQESTHTFPLILNEEKVHLSSKLTVITGTGYPKHGVLKEPQLLFDKADSSAVHLQPYHGLKNFGAFTKDKPEINVAFLGTSDGINELRTLVASLNNGNSTMPEGMSRFFNTKIKHVDTEEISSPDIEKYIEGAESLGTRNENRNSKAEVTLIYLPESTSYFNYNTSYYNVKPVLLEHGISSQAITHKTLKNPTWSYLNIGSALFAKSGAHPWVLAEDIRDFDMIIGIGLSQAISMTKRAGSNPKYIGYANVFDEQGRWMFFETTSEVYNVDDPVNQLVNLVRQSIKHYKQIKRVNPKTFAVHYFQRFSNEKIAAINNLLEEIVGDDYKIAYITIDKSHPMRLYDLNISDGSYPRAHYALLGENRILLSTTGYTDLGRKRLGTPAILNISTRQYPEKFVAIEDVAQHILALTRLNYKTLTPTVGEPVTLLFSNLAAGFMAAFSETQYSNARQSLNNKVNKVPWFL